MDKKAILCSVVIVLVGIAALVAKFYGLVTPEPFTIAMVIIVLLPFLASILSSVSLGENISLKFRVARQEARIEHIAFLLSHFLHIQEIIWLRSLAENKDIYAEPYGQYEPEDFIDLRRLVLGRLLKFKDGKSFELMSKSENKSINLRE